MNRAEAGALGHARASKKLAAWVESKKNAARRKWELAGATCTRCQKPLTYEQRRYRHCSRSCRSSESNAKRPRVLANSCGHCGKSFGGNSRKATCSVACAKAKASAEKVARWLAGELLGGTWRGVLGFVKRWLRDTRGNHCCECGWNKINATSGRIPLHVDHIDGDPNNHKPDNLRLLCPNCHSLTPTFGALNRGSGRAQRYAGKSQLV